jgi:hypothetical protein
MFSIITQDSVTSHILQQTQKLKLGGGGGGGEQKNSNKYTLFANIVLWTGKGWY